MNLYNNPMDKLQNSELGITIDDCLFTLKSDDNNKKIVEIMDGKSKEIIATRSPTPRISIDLYLMFLEEYMQIENLPFVQIKQLLQEKNASAFVAIDSYEKITTNLEKYAFLVRMYKNDNPEKIKNRKIILKEILNENFESVSSNSNVKEIFDGIIEENKEYAQKTKNFKDLNILQTLEKNFKDFLSLKRYNSHQNGAEQGR